jgi:ribosomal-protein-alanine N-acetyltransferase
VRDIREAESPEEKCPRCVASKGDNVAAPAASSPTCYEAPLHPPLLRVLYAVLKQTWCPARYLIENTSTVLTIEGGIRMLKGKNVLLRPIKRSDISYFLKWFNDPELVQYLDMYLPMTEMSEEKFIEELGTTRARSDAILVIEVIEGDSTRPIGNCGLHQINTKDQDAIFGIIIGEKDYWSRGYGVEAARLLINYGFEQLNLHRISSAAIAFNERSIRLHEKIGFRVEGRLRQAMFKNGQYHDRLEFGILKEEWKGL